MEIRHAKEKDTARIMEIYRYARKFMAEHGNPEQWGTMHWPPEALVRNDILCGTSYVCVHGDRIIGVFSFAIGKNIEPAYQKIEGGKWFDHSAYGVIHRLAGDGSEKGIGTFCLEWAYRQCGHLRADTHGDNIVVQNLLEKMGFVRCGIIYVEEDPYPRLAYEKCTGR